MTTVAVILAAFVGAFFGAALLDIIFWLREERRKWNRSL